MKKPIVSLITPTHRTDKLLRLYESIEKQTCRQFEWIVVTNGSADVSILPKKKWIKIIPYTDSNLNIGALKNFSFMQGQGELLAEVDHDDELTPNCVKILIENKDRADFLYSNNLVIDSSNGNVPYTWGPDFNWKYSSYNHNGQDCAINIAFPPYPGNFSYQWWAPNHIRVWRKDFYYKINGHNKELKACDDGDILCRTMIHGSIFHINEVLYIYYLHAGNTHAQKDLSDWIQKHSLYMHDTFIVDMAKGWCCNNNFSVKQGDEIFKDNNQTVGLIIIDKHLCELNSIETYMKQAYKVLVPGGIMVATNPVSIEQNYPVITKHQTSFWGLKHFKVDGVSFEINGITVDKDTNIFKAFFTKYAEGLHIARPGTNFQRTLNSY